MKKNDVAVVNAAGFLIGSGAAAPAYTLNVSTVLTMEDPMFKGLNQIQGRSGKALGRTGSKSSCSPVLNSRVDEDVLEQARVGAGVAVPVDGGRLAPAWSRISACSERPIWRTTSPKCARL